MAEQTKTLWEILVPKYTNDGRKYDISHHYKWDEYVKSLSGGLTILDTVKGQWIDNDKRLFSETMIPVRIYCDKLSIDKIVEFTIQHYNQKAVLAYELSTNIMLKIK